MTREENAVAAMVALCAYLSISPTYGDRLEDRLRDLREVMAELGEVPRYAWHLRDAAQAVLAAKGPRLRRNALTRLRIEVGGYFEYSAARRIAALRDLRGAA